MKATTMVFKMKSKAGLVLLACTLSGCIGASEFGGNQSYRDIAALPQTTVASMPTVGTASYSGYAGLDVMDNDIGDLDGDLSLTANFANSTVGGRISNLEGDAGAFNGSLAIEGGKINDSTFTGDLQGEISRLSNEKQHMVGAVFNGDSRMTGEFRGDGAEAVIGDFDGTVTHFEGSGPERFEAAVPIKGGFVAK